MFTNDELQRVHEFAREWQGCEVRPFTAWCPIVKAETNDKGDRMVYGPVASQKEDLDGESPHPDMSFLRKGLEVHARDYGGHVDWNHMFPKTGDTQYLIGKGSSFDIDGRPWMGTRLRPDNHWADEAFSLAKAQMHVGYSVWGQGVREGKLYKATHIQLVTIAPMPKGVDQFLLTSPPSGSLSSVAKAVYLDEPADGTMDGWVRMSEFEKAFTTGAGVVEPGSTGGAAIRTQYMAGKGGKLKTVSFDGELDPDGDGDGDPTNDEMDEVKLKKAADLRKSLENQLHRAGVKNVDRFADFLISRYGA